MENRQKKRCTQREQKQEQDLKVNKSQPNEKLRKMIEREGAKTLELTNV